MRVWETDWGEGSGRKKTGELNPRSPSRESEFESESASEMNETGYEYFAIGYCERYLWPSRSFPSADGDGQFVLLPNGGRILDHIYLRVLRYGRNDTEIK